jgi:hypothetical protein
MLIELMKLGHNFFERIPLHWSLKALLGACRTYGRTLRVSTRRQAQVSTCI